MTMIRNPASTVKPPDRHSLFHPIHLPRHALHPFLLKKSQNCRFDYVVFENRLHLQQRNKFFLAKNLTIQKLLAGICFLLFAFAITPKITLHNLVANHKDGRTKATLPDAGSTQLSKASFNCQCDNLISESPFIAETSPSYVIVATSFAAYKKIYVEEVYSTQQFCSTLRGPPVC